MSTQEELRKLPGVDKLLNDDRIKTLLEKTPREVVAFSPNASPTFRWPRFCFDR